MFGKKKKQEEPKTPAGQAIEFVSILAIAIALAIGIQAFLVKPFQIPSGSMIPTLSIGQRVLVDRAAERLGSDPKIGDIVVFHPPEGATDDQVAGGTNSRCGAPPKDGEPCSVPTPDASDQNFVKRVVAGPGDKIAVVGGHVILNGKRQSEPFAQLTCADGIDNDFKVAITVPKDSWYMMGDNRQCSEDSRYWGPVKRSQIIGGAFATYWPPKRIGKL